MSGASIETTLNLWASSLPDVKVGRHRCSRRSEWRDPRRASTGCSAKTLWGRATAEGYPLVCLLEPKGILMKRQT